MRIRSRAARCAAAAAVTVGAVTAATVAPASAAPSGISTSACPSKYFCAYQFSGDTHPCKWEDDAPDWDNCSWVQDGKFTYAVYNNGTSGAGVTMYRNHNYSSPIGSCVPRGKVVYLADNYSPGSSKWNC